MQIAARWPSDSPLIMLHSARLHRRWARWSILATPTGFFRFNGRSQWLACGRAGDRAWPGLNFRHDPLADLDLLLAATRVTRGPSGRRTLPFRGGWIGCFGYDLGRWIEPAAHHDPPALDDRQWPAFELAYCPSALIHDGLHGVWYAVGGGAVPELQEPQRADEPDELFVGELRSGIEPDRYVDAVTRTIRYIAAGDIFQANITQRFSATVSGSTRRLLQIALPASGAWYGAYLELSGGRCLLSLSPELFLRVDPCSRHVMSRPIKGTRPSAVGSRELLGSAKDAAELYMIVDLMRNDLGRICEYGSVRVPRARRIETHPTVHHGVGEVVGRLRAGVTFGEVMRATFPPGSVTGAPKIRAMQIIDELEGVRRGPYCGAIGFLSNCGAVGMSVAIRTLALSGRREHGRWDRLTGILDYGAGGGIVADSDPVAEYRESLDKVAVLRMALRERATKKRLAISD